MPGQNSNIIPLTMEEITSRHAARIYERERKLNPRATAAEQLDNNLATGIVQDGHSYVFDELVGAARPSSPQLVPFTWPGQVFTGNPSGPHLVILPNTSKIYLVTLAIGTVDPDAEITISFLLNGTEFTTLTLSESEASTFARYDSSWPPLGGNATDIIQVQCTACGTVGADLVAAVRIV
jgi:hypothetical protein